jgi:RND family efflux transporter MFP subunit
MRTTRLLVMTLTLFLLPHCNRERVAVPSGIPVRMETAKRSEFAPTLTLLGVVRAAQSVPVAAQQRGTVSYPSRFAGGLRTGERVTRGETLALVRNDDLLFQQSQTKLQMEAAAADLERYQRGFEAGIVRGADYSAAKLAAAVTRDAYANARRQTALLRLAAPADGTLVVTRAIAPGTTIDAQSTLAEIVGGGASVVESNVAATERAALRPSLPVHFSARTAAPWSGNGRITEVAAVVDAAGTARVVSTIDMRTDKTADVPPPGTGVELQVELDRRRDVLTVPEDALVAGGEDAALFIASAPEGRSRYHVKRISVVTGGRAGGRVEITSGLHDGDRVIVSGADSLAEDAVVVEAKE